ncbi:MFS transporter [Citrobacter sp. JGM124]|uniref:MFS transporter n=1 Tax=Citrobacter sp. JGM124 TaxID=2799789 RepID=UPI001BAB0EC7|nr:MFS transporter [Citrobacter sp. JGM124]MBS0849410.1 MFS transporter [Citrobacter sp. JGM124]
MAQLPCPASRSSVSLLPLLAPCIAQALIALDYASIYVALPALTHQLALSTSEMQWVISVYGLSFAALLLLGGSLCDRLGARLVFTAGISVFLLASMLGGMATDVMPLLIARSGQGLGAAMLQPAVMALIAQNFQGKSHNRALAIWGATGALGLVSGVMLGGILTAVSWRMIFFINVPPGLLALWLVRRHYLPIHTREITSTLGIGALMGCAAAGSCVWALMRYSDTGVADFLANRVACVMLLLFIFHERYAAEPLLSRTLRQIPGLQTGWLCSALYMASVGSQFYVMTLLWQQMFSLDTIRTGLLFTPLALLIVVGNIIYSRLSARFTHARLLMAGFACAGIGLKLLSVALTDSFSLTVITGLALSGLGHGLIYPAMFAVGLTNVPLAQQGRASALMITSQYMSGAVTLAIISVLLGVAPAFNDWSSVFDLLSALAFIGMMVAI